MSAVLAAEWTEALRLGMVPPQLVEYVGLLLGPGSYEREIEMALNGIRLEKRLDGMHASLPVFGHTLPLPVGWQSRDGKTVRFDSANEVAAFVRPILLGRDE